MEKPTANEVRHMRQTASNCFPEHDCRLMCYAFCSIKIRNRKCIPDIYQEKISFSRSQPQLQTSLGLSWYVLMMRAELYGFILAWNVNTKLRPIYFFFYIHVSVRYST